MEFEQRFLGLYQDLIRAVERRYKGNGRDIVHTVYVQIQDEHLIPPHGKRRFKEWFLELARIEGNVQYRIERQAYGKRRINEED